MEAFGELHRLSLEADEPFGKLIELAMAEPDSSTADEKGDDDGDGGGDPEGGPTGPGSES